MDVERVLQALDREQNEHQRGGHLSTRQEAENYIWELMSELCRTVKPEQSYYREMFWEEIHRHFSEVVNFHEFNANKRKPCLHRGRYRRNHPFESEKSS